MLARLAISARVAVDAVGKHAAGRGVEDAFLDR